MPQGVLSAVGPEDLVPDEYLQPSPGVEPPEARSHVVRGPDDEHHYI